MQVKKTLKLVATLDHTINGALLPMVDGDIDHGLGGFAKRRHSVYTILPPVVTSDARAKRNIVPRDHGLATILALHPKRYDMVNGERTYPNQLGLLAQELLEVLPESEVDDDLETPMGVRYQARLPVLIHATQEQQALIDLQSQVLAEQHAQLENQATRLSKQEARLAKLLGN